MRTPDQRTRLRLLVLALIATVVLAAATVLVIRVTGHPLGAPCRDSYDCGEFLLGGECLALDRESYCSRYCEDDAGCPPGWTCESAHPTVLAVETRYVDKICVRGADL